MNLSTLAIWFGRERPLACGTLDEGHIGNLSFLESGLVHMTESSTTCEGTMIQACHNTWNLKTSSGLFCPHRTSLESILRYWCNVRMVELSFCFLFFSVSYARACVKVGSQEVHSG